MDVPTIPERYVVRDPAMDICSFNRHRDCFDTEHGHRHTTMTPNRREVIVAVILIAVIIVGNLGGLWLAEVAWG